MGRSNNRLDDTHESPEPCSSLGLSQDNPSPRRLRHAQLLKSTVWISLRSLNLKGMRNEAANWYQIDFSSDSITVCQAEDLATPRYELELSW
jgi:hypothetical protein